MPEAGFTGADHLPNRRGGQPADPYRLPRQRRGVTPQMHGRYPDYDVLEQAEHWDDVTRRVVLDRLQAPPIRFFTPAQARTLGALCDLVTAQHGEPRVPVLEMVDSKLQRRQFDGFRYAWMPDDGETWRLVAQGLDEAAAGGTPRASPACPWTTSGSCAAGAAGGRDGDLAGGAWETIDPSTAWLARLPRDRGLVLLGMPGHRTRWLRRPAYPRGFARLGVGIRPRPGRTRGLRRRPVHASRDPGERLPRPGTTRRSSSIRRRAVPDQDRMARYPDSEEVDLAIVGCGAGGSVLAQRLARAGWRVVVLERGRSGTPTATGYPTKPAPMAATGQTSA